MCIRDSVNTDRSTKNPVRHSNAKSRVVTQRAVAGEGNNEHTERQNQRAGVVALITHPLAITNKTIAVMRVE